MEYFLAALQSKWQKGQLASAEGASEKILAIFGQKMKKKCPKIHIQNPSDITKKSKSKWIIQMPNDNLGNPFRNPNAKIWWKYWYPPIQTLNPQLHPTPLWGAVHKEMNAVLGYDKPFTNKPTVNLRHDASFLKKWTVGLRYEGPFTNKRTQNLPEEGYS